MPKERSALAIGAGKDQNIYIVDRTNMGKFNPNNDRAIYQEIDGVLGGGEWAMAAYFKGNIYFGPVGNNLLQFRILESQTRPHRRFQEVPARSIILAPRRAFLLTARATGSFGRSNIVIPTMCCTLIRPQIWRRSSTARTRQEINGINSAPPATLVPR